MGTGPEAQGLRRRGPLRGRAGGMAARHARDGKPRTRSGIGPLAIRPGGTEALHTLGGRSARFLYQPLGDPAGRARRFCMCKAEGLDGRLPHLGRHARKAGARTGGRLRTAPAAAGQTRAGCGGLPAPFRVVRQVRAIRQRPFDPAASARSGEAGAADYRPGWPKLRRGQGGGVCAGRIVSFPNPRAGIPGGRPARVRYGRSGPLPRRLPPGGRAAGDPPPSPVSPRASAWLPAARGSGKSQPAQRRSRRCGRR